MFRKLIKYLLRLLIGMILAVLLYLGAAVVLSLLSTRPDPVGCPQKEAIFVATNGVHLEIILPRALMKKELAEAFQAPPRAEYVSFGWGDKAFYLETPTWDDMQLGTALRAMFLRSETAMHLTYHYGASKAWYEISLCPVQRENLIAYLLESFERDEQGQLIEIPNAGYTPHDRFYEATGNYSFLRTCNNWANQALKKAQVKTARWSPFDYGVLHHLRDRR